MNARTVTTGAAAPPDRLLNREDWFALTSEEILEPDLKICDAHHHLWDHGPGKRYLLEEIAADAAGGHDVVSTIFCECRRAYRSTGPEELKPVGETDFMHALAERSAQSGARARIAHGIISYADFNLGTRVAATLEGHLAASPAHFRGIRHMTRWHEAAEDMDIPPRSPRGLMADARWREGFAQLSKYALPFDAWFVFTQYDELVDLARAFPDQTIVINHLGGVSGSGPYTGKRDGEVFEAWKKGVAAAAACPNVLMKLGGLGQPRVGFGWERREKPPGSEELARAYAPWYRHCIEQFGPQRCMFESNFPVERASCSYTVLWNTYKRITAEFTPEEKTALMHDNAARVYRLAPLS